MHTIEQPPWAFYLFILTKWHFALNNSKLDNDVGTSTCVTNFMLMRLVLNCTWRCTYVCKSVCVRVCGRMHMAFDRYIKTLNTSINVRIKCIVNIPSHHEWVIITWTGIIWACVTLQCTMCMQRNVVLQNNIDFEHEYLFITTKTKPLFEQRDLSIFICTKWQMVFNVHVHHLSQI